MANYRNTIYIISRFNSSAVRSFLVIVFLLVYNFTIDSYVAPVFGYFGIEPSPIEITTWAWIVFLALVPVYFLPTKLCRPSVFLLTFFIVLVYLPSLVMMYKASSNFFVGAERLFMQLTTFVCVSVLTYSAKIPLSPDNKKKRKYISITAVLAIAIVVLVCGVVLTFGTFQVVSLVTHTDLYAAREANYLTNRGLAAYIPVWCVSLVLPFCFAINSNRKSRIVVNFLILLMYLYFAFALGAKILLAIPFVLLFNDFVMRRWESSYQNVLIGFIIVASFFPFFLDLVSVDLSFIFTSIFHFRTLAVPQLAFAIYNDFFRNASFTYFTHIGIVGSVFHPVYPQGLPVALSDAYGLGNYNSFFLLNDGFAGYGYIGMVLVSILMAVILRIVDNVARYVNPRIFVLLLTGISMNLANVSLFTLLVTHGLLFAIVLLSKINWPKS